jgi:hypothetical protein
MPLPSSFWADEMATVFVVHNGSEHPSLAAAAPQAWRSIYYPLPRASEALLGHVFGSSEVVYRIPSLLAMGLALFLVARLAARLIHPQAGWFAVFGCFALSRINYHAADARPYALGFLIAAASLLFLVRWFDSAKYFDAILFAVFASLLWRVHLLFWPMYIVFAIYAIARLTSGATKASWIHTAVMFSFVGVALLPVLKEALDLYPDARAHVYTVPPSIRELAASLKWLLIAICGIGAWLLHRVLRWPPLPRTTSAASIALIVAFWLCQPLCLFAYSHLSGNGIFIPRYLAIALPGTALMATLASSFFLPAARWRQAALLLGIAALWLGQWHTPWPLHHNSDWRSAARAINQLPISEATPIICPSPFVEGVPPTWYPDYPISAFLYSHLPVYPIRGHVYPFPSAMSPEGEHFARTLVSGTLPSAGVFVLYGPEPKVHLWRDWFAAQSELQGWRQQRLGPFADVDVVVFQRP